MYISLNTENAKSNEFNIKKIEANPSLKKLIIPPKLARTS